jgi:hypothetical protein
VPVQKHKKELQDGILCFFVLQDCNFELSLIGLVFGFVDVSPLSYVLVAD